MKVEMILLSIVVAVGLLAATFWFRGEAIKAKADAENWKSAAETFQRANEQNAFAARTWKQAAVVNAAIADDLSNKIRNISQQSAAANAAVEKVYANDPEARAWADTVVPDSVRNASQTRH